MSVKATGRIWELDLPHAEAWVLMAMADHADHEGRNIYPGMGFVAWKTGYSKRQVQRVVNHLVELGILVLEARDYGRYQTNRYHIDWKRCPEKAAYKGRDGDEQPTYIKQHDDKMSLPISPEVSQRDMEHSDKMSLVTKWHDDKMSEHGDILSQHGDIAMSPKPSIEPSVKPSVEPAPKKRQAKDHGEPLPADFEITPDLRQWAVSKAKEYSVILNVALLADKFLLYYREGKGRGQPQKSWPGTWRQWVLSEVGNAKPANGNSQTNGAHKQEPVDPDAKRAAKLALVEKFTAAGGGLKPH